MKYEYGFIGAGNMGSALCRAVAKTSSSIAISDVDSAKASALADQLSCSATDICDLTENSKYIFIGVKPQVIESVLKAITDVLKKRNDRYVLVSMAAGVKRSRIIEILGFDCPLIRIMPNIPASVGSGVILTSPSEGVTKEETEAFVDAMSGAGLVDIIPESLIDAGCALSGSGPAYVYMFIESLADGAVKCGLTRDKALKYAAQTVFGAADHVLRSGIHPEALKDAVCSPSGTTIEGVSSLEERGFRDAVISAVAAGYKRSVELSK